MQSMNEMNLFDSIKDFAKTKKESIDKLVEDPFVAALLHHYQKDRTYVENHWIDFLDYQQDNLQCLNCSGLDQCPKSSQGMIQVLDIQHDPVKSFAPCKYGHEIIDKQNILSHVVIKNVSQDLVLTNVQSVVPLFKDKELYKMIDEFIHQTPRYGLYIQGPSGCGKSTLAGFIVRNLAKQGKNCGYIHFPIFLMDLKNSFNEYGNDNSIEQLRTVDYLVIDDLGGENVTNWSRDEVLSSIISYRYQNKKITIFTSLYDQNDLANIYSLKYKDPRDKLKVERLINTIFTMAMPIIIKR